MKTKSKGKNMTKSSLEYNSIANMFLAIAQRARLENRKVLYRRDVCRQIHQLLDSMGMGRESLFGFDFSFMLEYAAFETDGFFKYDMGKVKRRNVRIEWQ